MFRILSALALLASASTCPFEGSPPPASSGDAAPACFDQLVAELSTDAMQGRGIGTQGLEDAAVLLEKRLRAAGLQGAGLDYRQAFEVQVGVQAGAEGSLQAEGSEAPAEGSWTPLAFASPGSFEGELVFAGYGIRAEPLGYDDYAGLDVEGKVVLALRYEPGENDEDSPFDGRRATRWSDLRYKAFLAREAGAAALVFVDGPAAAEPDEEERLPSLGGRGPVSPAGLPVLQVKRSLAQAWLDSAGLDLRELQHSIDSTSSPSSTAVEGVTLRGRVDLEIELESVRNVLGLLPGEGALADELVVVGAHYDHLGLGGHGSMSPDDGSIHNGADDNASGVAAMICGVEELVAGLPQGPRRSLLVAAFAAEELGLLGSAWYVEHPVHPLEQTVAMVNLDMVGRMQGTSLSVLGSDSSPEWPSFVEGPGRDAGLVLELGGDGYGPSDQMSFYTRGIPVVHLFTGAHEDYHSPSDDAEHLNMEGGRRTARFLASTLSELVERDERLSYVRSSGAPARGADRRSSGAWLGSIPDYSAMSEKTGGVLLSGVRAGGPAEQGGLQAGDRIVRFGAVEIANLYDLTFALRDHEPDDLVHIEVLRGEERSRLAVRLGDRSARGEGGSSPHGAGGPAASGSSSEDWAPSAGKDASVLLHPEERHLADLRQLTFGGENAEAYFSPDGRSLVFQRTPPEGGCDQQFLMDLTSGEVSLLSSGKGRTTCGYYDFPAGESWVYATTEGGDAECPAPPDRSQGYVWPLYDSFEIVRSDAPGSVGTPWLPHPGYDAEATVCFADGRIVFTSVRSGDLELWVAESDGSGLKQLTDLPGYDGGAFFTPDCSEIVWRASRPEGEALRDYQRLLGQDLVRPGALEIFLMDSDGSNVRQLTDNGAANFGPYPLPDASGVVFSSNVGSSPREFDLWRVGREGGELERITHASGFDGFPMFSPDGRWLVFGSNRGGDGRETNLFVARWVP